MNKPEDPAKDSRKPKQGLPVEGGVVNRTADWQRTGEGDRPARKAPDRPTQEDTGRG